MCAVKRRKSAWRSARRRQRPTQSSRSSSASRAVWLMDDFSRAELARYAPMELKKQYPMLTPSRTAFGNSLAQTEFRVTRLPLNLIHGLARPRTVEDMINSARETYWDPNPQIVSRQRPWNSTHAGYQVAVHTNCTPTNTHSLLSMPCSHDHCSLLLQTIASTGTSSRTRRGSPGHRRQGTRLSATSRGPRFSAPFERSHEPGAAALPCARGGTRAMSSLTRSRAIPSSTARAAASRTAAARPLATCRPHARTSTSEERRQAYNKAARESGRCAIIMDMWAERLTSVSYTQPFRAVILCDVDDSDFCVAAFELY